MDLWLYDGVEAIFLCFIAWLVFATAPLTTNKIPRFISFDSALSLILRGGGATARARTTTQPGLFCLTFLVVHGGLLMSGTPFPSCFFSVSALLSELGRSGTRFG